MEPRTGHSIRTISPGEIEGIAALMARAFFDDPVVGVWLFPDETSRLDGLRSFFTAELRHITLPHGECLTDDAATGAALWVPPGAWEVPVTTVVRLLPLFARLFGRRLPRNLRALSMIEKVHPRAPHYYLPYIGVVPESQGQGTGSALLAAVLRRCDAEGIGAYLEASSEGNRRLYVRHGFSVVGEIDLPDGPPLWPMWREPRS